MSKEFAASVFIGRFQPFHNSHKEVVEHGLRISDRVIIVIGSCNAAPNIRNPFLYNERRDMIRASFSEEDNERIHITGVRDYFNNDNHWLADVQQKVHGYVSRTDSIALLGNFKDGSSYYLKMFPQWEFAPVRTALSLDATTVRTALFRDFDHLTSKWSDHGIGWRSLVPEPVWSWIVNNFVGTERHLQLCREDEMIRAYKASWKDAPFPPIFVTTDAVVVTSGHVLLVRRKFEPGKGLLALPGGFLKQTERIEDGMLRELHEETGIRVPKPILRSSIREWKVFDHPDRSLRGRTITHAAYIRLPDGDLPDVKGSDDAERAFWLPLMDVGRREHEFFEDHAAIVGWFIGR